MRPRGDPREHGRHRGRGATSSWCLPLAFNDERRKGGHEVWWLGDALRACRAQEGRGGAGGTGYRLAFIINCPYHRSDSHPNPPPFPPAFSLPNPPSPPALQEEGQREQTQKVKRYHSECGLPLYPAPPPLPHTAPSHTHVLIYTCSTHF